jgi:hypothetical protein
MLNNHSRLLPAAPRCPAEQPGGAELLSRAKAIYSPQELGALRAFTKNPVAQSETHPTNFSK